MTPDAILNLLWLLVVAGALAVWSITELRRLNPSTCRARIRRGIAVLAATVALFPCLSASDDVVSLRQLQPPCQLQSTLNMAPSSQGPKGTGHYLAQLLEVLENFHPSHASSLALVLACLAFILSFRKLYSDQSLPSATGRAPPLFS